MKTNTETTPTPQLPETIRLPNIAYSGHDIRRVSLNGIEMICLKDVLTICGYLGNKNASLHYKRAGKDQTGLVTHAPQRPPMMFGTVAGVLQMVSRMLKDDAPAFAHWLSVYASIEEPASVPQTHTETTDLRNSLIVLKMDILEKAQELHDMRVEAATMEAAFKAMRSATT